MNFARRVWQLNVQYMREFSGQSASMWCGIGTAEWVFGESHTKAYCIPLYTIVGFLTPLPITYPFTVPCALYGIGWKLSQE